MALARFVCSALLRQPVSILAGRGCLKAQRRLFASSISLHSTELPSMGYILKQNNIPEDERKRIEKEVEELTKDWVSTGFHFTDKQEDTYRYNLCMFMIFSVFSSLFTLYMWYLPNKGNSEWARREAFLELERRRRDGLPLVDRDLVPASQVKLPTDEELGPNFKIII